MVKKHEFEYAGAMMTAGVFLYLKPAEECISLPSMSKIGRKISYVSTAWS